jgi:6-phosphofructokinase 1
MKVGILTSGGDCPGLNAVIRAIVRKGCAMDAELVGIYDGWKGIIDEEYIPLDTKKVAGIVNRGGTILGTSRFNPFQKEDGEKLLLEKIAKAKFDAIIAIGGEGSAHMAYKAYGLGVNIVGVPKTIDNDIPGTDITFGFDTAVSIATDAIDRLHTTAESHHRIMVLEVMGRHTGWIALHSGIAGGADIVLLPEFKMTIDEVVEIISRRNKQGKLFSIIVVAEGAEYIEKEICEANNIDDTHRKKDEFGRKRLGGIGNMLAEEIEKRSGFETRATILGYVQRGGVPTAFDRMLGTRLGIHAMDMVGQKKYGRMCAVKGTEIIDIPLTDCINKLKTVPVDLYEAAKVFFN